MTTALLRGVPETFDQAIVGGGGRAPDVALARAQHRGYRKALEDSGYRVEVIPEDNAMPDCVFVEDTAVVLPSMVVATRPGAIARRSEVSRVAAHLSRRFSVAHIEAPGTLEGGDVMIMGKTVFVGRSARTNDEGIAQLAEIVTRDGMTLVAVPVAGVLHLKSGVLPVDDETVVVTPGTVDESILTGLRIVHEVTRERNAFSALPLADGTVLVTATAPDTAAELIALGLAVSSIDVSEIQAADGGLTCMSILIDD